MIIVNEKQVEVDEQTTVAVLLAVVGFPGPRRRRGLGPFGAAAIRMGDKTFRIWWAIRSPAVRGGYGGAGWLTN